MKIRNNPESAPTTAITRYLRSTSGFTALLVGSTLLFTGCGRNNDEVAARDTTTTTTDRSMASSTPSTTAATTQSTAAAQDQSKRTSAAGEATIVLDEEKLNVQKRQVDQGGVLITKDVETRQVNQPVELQKETVEIERLTPEQARERGIAMTEQGEQIGKDEVFIPLKNEEAVVQKEVQPREVVRAETKTTTEQQNVDATLRREVVDVERQGAQASMQSGSQLEQRIRTELRSADDLQLDQDQISQINIRVNEDTVTLTGTVPNQQAATQIEQRIRQMDGVENVENQLRPSEAAAE